MLRKVALVLLVVAGAAVLGVGIASWWVWIEYHTTSNSNPVMGILVTEFGAALTHYELDAPGCDPEVPVFSYMEWRAMRLAMWWNVSPWQYEWRKVRTVYEVSPTDRAISTWIYVPLWLPAGILLAYPALAFIRSHCAGGDGENAAFAFVAATA